MTNLSARNTRKKGRALFTPAHIERTFRMASPGWEMPYIPWEGGKQEVQVSVSWRTAPIRGRITIRDQTDNYLTRDFYTRADLDEGVSWLDAASWTRHELTQMGFNHV